ISSFLSYAIEKRFSRHPHRFGKGAGEGVAAPEAGNNGAASSSFIPLLTLGIPGNASIPLIFAALLIHGIRPGPLLVAQHPRLDFEPAPLVLAMMLGPQVAASVRRALIFGHGDVFIFFERPISAVLMVLAALILLSPFARWALSRKFWAIIGPVSAEK